MYTLSGYSSTTVCHMGANDSINVNDLQSCVGGRLLGFPPVREQVTSAHPCSRNWISTVFPVTFGVSPVRQSSTTTNKIHRKIRSHHQNKTIKGGRIGWARATDKHSNSRTKTCTVCFELMPMLYTYRKTNNMT